MTTSIAISALSSANTLSGSEAVPLVQSSATVKATAQNIANTVSVVNGAAIDNSIIGGTTPAAGSFTSITCNTLSLNDVSPAVPVCGIYNSGSNEIALSSNSQPILFGINTSSSDTSFFLSTSNPAALNIFAVGSTNDITLDIVSQGAGAIILINGNSDECLTADSNANVIVGSDLISTSATGGFLCITGGNGAPTGNPSLFSPNTFPLYYDYANNKLYARNTQTNAWKGVSLT